MEKQELAQLLGITTRTLRDYLLPFRSELEAMGVKPRARKLPPQAVKFLSEILCFDLP